MTPHLLAAFAAALVAAGLGVGVGIGAAIWEGGSSPPADPPAAAAAANATASWLFVVTADAGVVTATGGDALTIELRGTAPRAVAFTDRPERAAKAVKTPALWAALYADGAAPPNAAPPNAALSFEHAGEAVVVPLEMLNVTGTAPNYTVAARALGAGGLSYLAAEMAGDGAAVVRGPGDPLWAALGAGLAVDAPELFVDDVVASSLGSCFDSHLCNNPPTGSCVSSVNPGGTTCTCFTGPKGAVGGYRTPRGGLFEYDHLHLLHRLLQRPLQQLPALLRLQVSRPRRAPCLVRFWQPPARRAWGANPHSRPGGRIPTIDLSPCSSESLASRASTCLKS
jgi:hypothetical protein